MNNQPLDIPVQQAVYLWLKELLPEQPVEYENNLKDITHIMMKTAPGETFFQRYKSGGYLSEYAFELYFFNYKTQDTKDRIDAIEILRRVPIALDNKQRPAPPDGYAWTGHKIGLPPHLFDMRSDGSAIYQMTASLTFRRF